MCDCHGAGSAVVRPADRSGLTFGPTGRRASRQGVVYLTTGAMPSIEFATGRCARITARTWVKGTARANTWASGKGWISTPAVRRIVRVGEPLEVARCHLGLVRFTDIAVRARGSLEEVAILPGNHVQYMIDDRLAGRANRNNVGSHSNSTATERKNENGQTNPYAQATECAWNVHKTQAKIM
jgi:hypothetical protein